MAKQGFGRRQSTLDAVAEPSSARSPSPSSPTTEYSDDPVDTGIGGSTKRSAVILACVAGVAVIAALGAVSALNAALPNDNAVVPQQACSGQADCINKYRVTLRCGTGNEPRTINVVAYNAEAAERKAERYNRSCRSHSTVFVKSLINSAVNHAVDSARSRAVSRRVSYRRTSSRRRWRFRWR